MTNPSEYTKYLRRFCSKFEDGLEEVIEEGNNKTGYVFLFVREIAPDCIDLATNLSPESVKEVLEMLSSNYCFVVKHEKTD